MILFAVRDVDLVRHLWPRCRLSCADNEWMPSF